jgi:nucleotidyltransferase substrate binding protein (TIGR01987 family)
VADADVRWQQRFANFQAALDQLEGFFEPPALNEREQQGLIKAFEYCFELGWSTLRDLLLAEGNADLLGSRDTLRLAFSRGLIDDGEAWMRMIQDRNLTSHSYLPCFLKLRQRLEQRIVEQQQIAEQQPSLAFQASGLSNLSVCLQPSLRCKPFGCLARAPWGGISRARISISAWRLPGSPTRTVCSCSPPWRVDLVLQHQLDADVQHYVQWVGQCIWSRP